MNILLLGGGGREHAIADKIISSPKCDRLIIAPGNAGTALLGKNVNANPEDFEAVKALVEKEYIDLVIVGPEAPLVKGIVDYFQNDDSLKNIPIIGPSANGAQLEGSKDFAKEFMKRHDIPTATHASFQKENLEDALRYIQFHPTPIVLKADGLAAGKGVVICATREEAKTEVEEMLSGKFGEASSKVVIEQFLKGIEFSVFVLTDGKDYVLLPEAKDYKRIGEGDTGLNTGGMGAVSPVPFVDDVLWKKVKERIIEPTIKGIREENIDYKGFVFFGLINVDGEPYVIEYNCRLGDPETEVVLPRLATDFVEICLAAWEGKLKDVQIEIDPRSAVTIMLVSKGYPGDYEKGKLISGLDHVDGSRIYHAGTSLNEKAVLTNGGRVIALTSMGSTMQRALEKSLRNAEVVQFEGKNYRKDIGRDLV
jgi:phosphoribosylamine--glycine ligase